MCLPFALASAVSRHRFVRLMVTTGTRRESSPISASLRDCVPLKRPVSGLAGPGSVILASWKQQSWAPWMCASKCIYLWYRLFTSNETVLWNLNMDASSLLTNFRQCLNVCVGLMDKAFWDVLRRELKCSHKWEKCSLDQTALCYISGAPQLWAFFLFNSVLVKKSN